MNAKAFLRAMEQDRDQTLGRGERLIAETAEKLRLGTIDGLFTRDQQATMEARVEGYKGLLAGMEAVYTKYLAVVQEIDDKDARQDADRAAKAHDLYDHLGPRVAYEEFARLLVEYMYLH
jgi:cation transport regulator ChaB